MMSFGFWVALLAPHYLPRVWSQHLSVAFPSKPSGTSLKQIARTTRDLNILRNRIFHHEPILHRNLSEDYSTAVRLIGWMSPTTETWVRSLASLPAILRQKP